MTPAPEVGNDSQPSAFSIKDNTFAPPIGYLAGKDISHHGKPGNKLRIGLAEYLLRGAYLLDAPITENRNAVAQGDSLLKIMGNMNRG
jgi:hypothetical protein